jgi:hypothetical protein
MVSLIGKRSNVILGPLTAFELLAITDYVYDQEMPLASVVSAAFYSADSGSESDKNIGHSRSLAVLYHPRGVRNPVELP